MRTIADAVQICGIKVSAGDQVGTFRVESHGLRLAREQGSCETNQSRGGPPNPTLRAEIAPRAMAFGFPMPPIEAV